MQQLKIRIDPDCLAPLNKASDKWNKISSISSAMKSIVKFSIKTQTKRREAIDSGPAKA